MTQLPLALPGMLLPGAPAVPGTVPTPHDPAGADPFLALLSQLVAPASPGTTAPDEPGQVPGQVPAPAADLDTGADAEEKPDEATAEPGMPVLPVLPVLPAFVPPAPVPVTSHATQQDAAPEQPAAQAAAPHESAAPAAAPAPATQPPQLVSAPLALLTNRLVSPEAPAPAPPVAHQVFPEVVRAAVSSVAPNRVVVRLQPEHLGEVRIVLRTDRSGSLEVSIAGGTEARAAMREGAPELRRLLAAAGSHEARVVVRHLAEPAPGTAPGAVAAVTAAAPTTSARTDLPTTAGDVPVDVGAGTAGGASDGASSRESRGGNPQDTRPQALGGVPDPTADAPRAARGPAGSRAGALDVMM